MNSSIDPQDSPQGGGGPGGGGGGGGEDYRNAGTLGVVLSRGPWLGLFCTGLVATAFVIESYEELIESRVQLSFFLPLIIGHGGNQGSQVVSALIRALALRQVQWSDLAKVVAREGAAGGLVGLVLGLGMFALAKVFLAHDGDEVSSEVGLVVALTMPVISLWSSSVAAIITLGSHRAGLDPIVSAGPAVATVVDATGLLVYLWIAKGIMKVAPVLDLPATGEAAAPGGGGGLAIAASAGDAAQGLAADTAHQALLLLPHSAHLLL